MRAILSFSLFTLILPMAAGCSDSAPAENFGAIAGAAGTVASPAGGAGASGAGGVASGGVSAGGSASGGISSGGISSGGTSSGGISSGGTSSGGGVGGSAAGSAGAGGGTSSTAKPSAGCGKLNPPTGARTVTTGGQTGMFNVNLPAGYDPNEPMPLGFGFHGFGNGACGPTQGECRGFAMLPAVTVYMKSISDGWEQGAVLEQNVTFWQDVLALMKSEYCIDESRIFIAGVSSGGQFIEHLTCRFGDTLWQVTPVSASVVGAANNNCKGTPPILVIHGVTDQAGNYGQGVAEMFAKRNGCSAALPAGLAQAKTDMMTAFNAKQAEHVCLDWDACTANPVRFCISSQITYSGLTHGWPQVGGSLISEFQQSLP